MPARSWCASTQHDHSGEVLVGREFRVGGATLRGVELCEPCRHLGEVAGKMSVLPTLVHRGGLHAQVISDGANRTGDVNRAT
jgi:MOSC domain-containing protein YiiM